MNQLVIEADSETETGSVTLGRKENLIEIYQDNGRAFPPTLYLSHQQAEQLRDRLIGLFEVEK